MTRGPAPGSSASADPAGAALARAARQLQAGAVAAARAEIETVLTLRPREAMAFYLLGAAAKAENDVAEAEVQYRRAIALDPGKPQVFNGLGAALIAQGRHGEAAEAFAEAVRLEPRYHEARRNLGAARLTLGDVAAAAAAYEAAVKAAPRDASALIGLGRARQAAGREAEALALFDRALAARPGHPRALHAKGACLHAMGRLDAARETLAAARAAGRPTPGLLQESARVAFRRGDHDEALQLARAALAATPFDVQIHRDLNQMLYMLDDPAFLASYREALARRPDDPGLLAAFAQSAALADRPLEAKDVLAAAVEGRGVRHPTVAVAYGHLLSALKEGEAALRWLQAGVAAAPDDKAARQTYCAALLEFGAPDAARAEADAALALDPDDQVSLAYWVTARQLQGAAAADGVFDVPRLTQKRPIRTPPGFADLPAFNAALAERLTALHQSAQEPLDQSLRGGTQVELLRLAPHEPLVGALHDALRESVGAFAAGLPDDARHPFLRRRPRDIAFTGMWSVRLRSGGRHVSHAHPEGWLSSCYYVSLPPVVSTGAGRQGWLRFGDPPMPVSGDLPTADIQPEAGALALFPSYFWHGTIPFESDTPRLTVAFDVAPA